jgi:hypothetical protein
LLVADLLQPIDSLAIEGLCYGDMAHRASRRGTVFQLSVTPLRRAR